MQHIEESKADVQAGIGFIRLPGPSKVQQPTTAKGQAEEVRSVSNRIRYKLGAFCVHYDGNGSRAGRPRPNSIMNQRFPDRNDTPPNQPDGTEETREETRRGKPETEEKNTGQKAEEDEQREDEEGEKSERKGTKENNNVTETRKTNKGEPMKEYAKGRKKTVFDCPAWLPQPFRPSDRDVAELQAKNPPRPPNRQSELRAFQLQFEGKGTCQSRAAKIAEARTLTRAARHAATKDSVGQIGSVCKNAVKGATALVAEDKSPKGSWAIPAELFVSVCVLSALIAGWTVVPGLQPVHAEYTLRGWWADNPPTRMRKYLNSGMSWGGRFLPYYYNTVKLKCHGGEDYTPEESRDQDSGGGVRKGLHTCTKFGHSCLREVVSYFRLWGRATNKLYHRGAQELPAAIPTWGIWSLGHAPQASQGTKP